MSLKGPILNSRTGLKISIDEKMEREFIKSVINDIEGNTAVKSMVVDTLNCSQSCVDELVSAINIYGDKGKKIFILE